MESLNKSRELRLIRLEDSPSDHCIRGILLVNGNILCCTLELRWRENLRNISCVPTGNYYVNPYKSKKFGNTYKLRTVPNRDGILFHAGNTYIDTEGCILVGEGYGTVRGFKAVTKSRGAMTKLKSALEDHNWNLEIIDLTWLNR